MRHYPRRRRPITRPATTSPAAPTNLTATAQPRSANGLYRVEYEWTSTQQTVQPETIKPTYRGSGNLAAGGSRRCAVSALAHRPRGSGELPQGSRAGRGEVGKLDILVNNHAQQCR